MGTNATSGGSSVSLEQLDALFKRLSTLTSTHKNSTYQINASAISDMKSSSGLSKGDLVKTDPLTELKQGLNNLSKSKWYLSNTNNNDTITTMTDYGANITIPTVGSLISASDFNLLENAITTAETVIPSYSSKYNNQYGTDYSGRYGTDYSGQYGTDYSGQYTSDYRSDYRFQYATDYRSDYRFQYASDYSTCYSTCYSSRYRSDYSTCYRTCYSTCYSYCASAA